MENLTPDTSSHAAHRVAAITGASGDLGAALARGFASHGWNVALIDLNADALAEIGDPIGGLSVPADVTSTDDVAAAVAAIDATWGRIDALINAAGITRPGASEELSPSDWRRVIDVNLSGAFHASQACFSHLHATAGSIVNITSIAATRAMPGRAAYTASKAGLEGLTASLAVEWAPRGVRVNAVAPAWIDNAFVRTLAEQGVVDRDDLISRIPLGRLCSNDDVVSAVAFLADSRQSGFITGQTLAVDGGYLPAG